MEIIANFLQDFTPCVYHPPGKKIADRWALGLSKHFIHRHLTDLSVAYPESEPYVRVYEFLQNCLFNPKWKLTLAIRDNLKLPVQPLLVGDPCARSADNRQGKRFEGQGSQPFKMYSSG